MKQTGIKMPNTKQCNSEQEIEYLKRRIVDEQEIKYLKKRIDQLFKANNDEVEHRREQVQFRREVQVENRALKRELVRIQNEIK